ncbi:MAG: hypothetical protein AVDCRST_MAG67-3984 [uncultured Solirubrobacteraceae bacterium]|uniref:Uncharacterized protein n=1 Tax=uncultured Solirubrobacteraceae bacterium TaxID=1162706 RepID=A0A6J4TQ16_9ACTN|nr:MAG: hypothetical protein AVDCRST_MAG67-3984 [uncultured Solirubrobacteraceae bacterium]
MRPPYALRRTPWTAAGVAVAVACGGGGCGADDEFANEERSPAPLTLSASITRTDVTVSPSRLGAGTIELIASNLTSTSQRLTLRSRALSGGVAPLEQRTGPINPGDTASLTADLAQGTYRVTTGSRAIAPATIRVGPRRRSAQDQLLQP